MGWGILNVQGDVPGTAMLEDLYKSQFDGTDTSHLKKARDGTILVPQPSDDPRDPLNWSMTKKMLCFISLCYMAGLAGAVGPLVASGYAQIAIDTGASVNTVASSNGYLLIGLGVAMFFQSSLAVKFGRRPIFLISTIILFTCSIWSAVSTNNTSFTVSRVFQGVGMASFEALVTATIADLFFVHQRGKATTLWGFSIISGISIAPLVNGYIVESSLRWKWCFWLIAIAHGIGFFLVLFFVPETIYKRDAVYDTDLGASASEASKVNDAAAHTIQKSAADEEEKGSESQAETVLREHHVHHNFLPAKTWRQELAPWSGYVSEVSFWKVFLRPFYMFASPIVFCGFFIYGMTTMVIVALSVASSIIFGLPPLNFNASQTGLMSIGPFIASILGAMITGPLIDFATKFFAKRNNGVHEPESRLLLLIPMFVFCLAGFLGWYGLEKAGSSSWALRDFLYAMIYFGNGFGSTAIVVYIMTVIVL